MEEITQALPEQSIVWLLLTATVSMLCGILSSWLTYRFVKRKEIIDTISAQIEKYRDIQELETKGQKQERLRREVIRWANPILGSVQSLKSELDNILNNYGYLAMTKNDHSSWLKEDLIEKIKP